MMLFIDNITAMCKSITIHKDQGMTVVKGQQFNTCLACLPTGKILNTPGLELVPCSRAKAEENFALSDEMK